MIKKIITLVLTSQLLFACSTMAPKNVLPPKVGLADAGLVEMGLFEQTYSLTLSLQNPNEVDIPITGMRYSVKVNDEEFATGVSDKEFTLQRLSNRTVATTIKGNLLKLAPKLGLKISDINKSNDTKIKYEISGEFTNSLGGPIPFSEVNEISISELMSR